MADQALGNDQHSTFTETPSTDQDLRQEEIADTNKEKNQKQQITDLKSEKHRQKRRKRKKQENALKTANYEQEIAILKRENADLKREIAQLKSVELQPAQTKHQ